MARSLSAAHVAKVFSHVENEADPSALVSSWRRCLTVHGLNPDSGREPGRVEQLRIVESRQRNEAITRAADDIIDQLIATLVGADSMIFLTDAEGIVIDTRSKRTGDFWDRPRNDWLGTDFSEAQEGTNGVGTMLREGRPLTVAGDQHFHTRDVPVTCSGAPIFGLDGAIAGCLDISCTAAINDALANSLMLAAAIDAARRIELRMLSNAHPTKKLVMASRTGENPGAVLAVDEYGGVVGATRAARVMLKLKPEHLAGTLSVEQLWDGEAREPDWTATERRMIEAALARHRGNASATARALGMSRSTLYRKLQEYAAANGTRMS